MSPRVLLQRRSMLSFSWLCPWKTNGLSSVVSLVQLLVPFQEELFQSCTTGCTTKWCKQVFRVCVHFDQWKIKNTRMLSLVIFQSYSDVQSAFELQVHTMHGYNSANLALISWNLVLPFLGRRKKSSVGSILPSAGDDPMGMWP